jgi:hypothetical protein
MVEQLFVKETGAGSSPALAANEILHVSGPYGWSDGQRAITARCDPLKFLRRNKT